MKNKILQITRDSIPYVKSLRTIAGSVTACILMQQLDYWFSKHPDGFFKFLEPCPNSSQYREGDSWSEELGFSTAEFRTAFDAIGVRYNSKRQYDAAAAEGVQFCVNDTEDVRQKFYCSYHDKFKGVTVYFRNHELVDAELDKLQFTPGKVTVRRSKSLALVNEGSQSTEIDNLNLRKSTTSIYVDEESQPTYLHDLNLLNKDAEITTETTTKNTHNTERAPRGVGVASKFSLEECRRYAAHLQASGQGINNPGGYATIIHRSGEADFLIEQFLNPSTVAPAADVTACPDCSGTGFWYPEGVERGVSKCKHERL